VLTKADLREHQPAGFVPEGRDLASALATGEVELVKTSGSTSDAVTNVWCQKWWDACEASSWKLHAATASARLGDHREAILSSPRCVGFASDVGLLSMEQRMLRHYLFLTEKADPAEWSATFCDRMIEELRQFEPAVLEANPSFLSVLCRHAIKHRCQVYQPAVVTLTYENPSLIHLRHIRSTSNARRLAPTAQLRAGMCSCSAKLADFIRMSNSVTSIFNRLPPPRRAHGRTDPGHHVHNPWRALIRFDMGDLVRLAVEPCPCGRHEGLTLDAVEGRVANATLRLRAGLSPSARRMRRSRRSMASISTSSCKLTLPRSRYGTRAIPEIPRRSSPNCARRCNGAMAVP